MKLAQESKKNRHSFLKGMLGLLLFVFIIFVGRFGQIMLLGEVNHQDLKSNAVALHERSSTLQAKRGTIYDIGGNPIAMDATSYSLLAILTDQWVDPDAKPNHVEDKEKTAEVLSKHIDMSKEDILKTLNTKNASQVEFGNAGKDLSYAEMRSIEQEKLQGITFEETPTRLYPNGVFASHLIGYASFKEAQNKLESRVAGDLGLEMSLDDQLKGKNGGQSFTTNHENFVTDKDDTSNQPKDGQDVYTTLDSRLQTYMESLMTEAYEKYEPESMTGMLVDPKTGKIAAATQRPTFNAQTKEGIEDMWQNLLVETPYEPGSTIKVLTVAAAIQEGVFDPNDYYQSGAVTVGNQTIRDYNKVGWGTISYLEGLAHSSNVLMVKLVGEIGYDKWEEYLYEFGLLQKPQSGLANEASGSMNYTYEPEKVSTSFGQGIYVTPWQLVQAFTAIANNGKVMKLQTVDRYEDESGNIKVTKPESKQSPISKETAQKTLKYLNESMKIDGSTTSMYQIEGHELAVKSGTAEIYDEDSGGYLEGESNYLFSVAGFAPADDPQYILYITLRRPQKNTQVPAPTILSEIFNPLMTRALDYGKLDTHSGDEQVDIPDVQGTDINAAQQQLSQAGILQANVLGDGQKVIDQVPKANQTINSNVPVYLLTDGKVQMPDFTGLDLNSAQSLAQMLGIKLEFEGDGVVVAQSIKPGAALGKNTELVIQLQET